MKLEPSTIQDAEVASAVAAALKAPFLVLAAHHDEVYAVSDESSAPSSRATTPTEELAAGAALHEPDIPSLAAPFFASTLAPTVILQEDIDENCQPTEAEIDEYAQWLGMVSPDDDDRRWIALEGLKAPCPPDWKPCKTSDGQVYYYNFATAESLWDHPCDEHYRKMFDEEKRKKLTAEGA